VVALLTLLFDLYWITQWRNTPDVAKASAILRFGLYTPCALLFCAADLRGWLSRLQAPLLLILAVAPCMITSFLCARTMEMVAAPEIYGTPLILLFTGALMRMRLPMVLLNVAISTAIYILGILSCRMLSMDVVDTVLFIQLVVSVAVIACNVQLESRDRRVFMLMQIERIRRSMVAAENGGLLLETQTDALTTLPNRRCFDETIAFRWLEALRAGTSLSLIMIDVDHFKKFNDHYGHVMGDDCLRRVAAALSKATRGNDLVARYGGEEFAVLLSDGDARLACIVAERLRAAVAKMALPHEGAGDGAIVTISLGLATTCPENPTNIRTLIEDADRNLYAAKRAGRNRVEITSNVAFPWNEPTATTG
jgi:diguanylate cyclase (GGDEF)-like protein